MQRYIVETAVLNHLKPPPWDFGDNIQIAVWQGTLHYLVHGDWEAYHWVRIEPPYLFDCYTALLHTGKQILDQYVAFPASHRDIFHTAAEALHFAPENDKQL